MHAKSSVDCCKILKFWGRGSEIWGVKHGPSHDKCHISSDPPSLTLCIGGIFSRRPTIFCHLVDVLAYYRSLYNIWNISIDGRDMGSQTWSLARQFWLFLIFPGTLTSKTTNFRRIDFCYFSHIWSTQKVLWTAAKFWSSEVGVPRYGESNTVPHTTSVIYRAIPQVWPSVVRAFSAVNQRFSLTL